MAVPFHGTYGYHLCRCMSSLVSSKLPSNLHLCQESFPLKTHQAPLEQTRSAASYQINVYCAVVLPTLLYGCEAWTPYRRHIRRLNQSHIANIKWQDMIPNIEVLQRCAQNGIEHHIKCNFVGPDTLWGWPMWLHPQGRVLRRTGRRSSNTGRTMKAVQGRA